MLCSAVLHRPDLIDFDKLKKSNAHYNLQNAFNLAEQHLGLTKLLDPEGKDSRDERWDFNISSIKWMLENIKSSLLSICFACTVYFGNYQRKKKSKFLVIGIN